MYQKFDSLLEFLNWNLAWISTLYTIPIRNKMNNTINNKIIKTKRKRYLRERAYSSKEPLYRFPG